MVDRNTGSTASAARWPKRTGLVAGVVAALVGLLVLFGWYSHSPFLVQVEPDLVPMQFTGALSLVLSGLGLVALMIGWRAVGAVLGGLVALFSLLTLAEYAFGASLGIDQLFFQPYLTVRTAVPGRLAPNTALAFLLLGTALFLFGVTTRRKGRPVILGLLGSMSIALGAVAFVGYMLGIRAAYGWGNLTDMAVHAALAFIVTGAGVVALAWHDAMLSGVNAPRWLPLLVGVSASTVTLLLWQALRAQQEEYHSSSTLPEVVLVNGLLVSVLLAIAVYLAQEERARAGQAEAANTELRLEVTERQLAQQRLAESEHNYRTLMEQASDGIFVFDPEGKLIDVNSSACEMVGYTRDELLAMNFADLVSPANLRVNPLRLGELQEGKTVRVERDLVCRDGSILPTEMSERMVDPGRLQSIVRDITERRRAEAALKQMNEELERRVVDRTAQLEAAVKELEAFSYSVSHDLRAPLRALTGFSDGLLEDYGDRLDAEGQRYLEMIRNNARNMGQLIDDLLAFSRLGRQQMGESRIDMAQLARSIAGDLSMENQDRRIEFVVGDLPPAQGDRAMIRQVFTNLLSNAVKFTRQREVSRIEVGGYEEDGQAVYYVKDNGAGFDMQYAHKLFGVFQRLHSTREFEGNGVGLALVQRIVNRHGGRVWAEGRLHEGATFYFSLPLAPDRQRQSPPLSPVPRQTP